MAKFTSRADLLIAAGESIKMQEKAGTIPVCKIDTDIEVLNRVSFILDDCKRYSFPLAVIEGKPVFVGDELYSPLGMRFIVDENGMPCCPNICSWNPPKPKTVMVELPIEDVEKIAKPYVYITVSNEGIVACRKALEKA